MGLLRGARHLLVENKKPLLGGFKRLIHFHILTTLFTVNIGYNGIITKLYRMCSIKLCKNTT